MGEKSATNVIVQLDSTRSLNLSAFLSALGLPGIGPELASAFAREVGEATTLFDLLAAPEDAIPRLVTIDGVGETVARSFLEGLDERRSVVEGLVEVLNIEAEEVIEEADGPLTNQTFCITGTLDRPRKEIALMIKAAGGKVVSTVSGKLDHLVAGNSAGSKLDKANRLSVNVLSEVELEAMLAGETIQEDGNVDETAGEIVADVGPQQMSLGDYGSTEPLE
tara:strand:- start:112 stop:777 length:666 start_codon:yes stop_codon:yes gene_type:complete